MRQRRVLVLRLPRLASDRLIGRARFGVAQPPPFAVVAEAGTTRRLACLTPAAEAAGLVRGMALADARALCPALATAPADPLRDGAFLAALGRWAGRFSPLVGRRGMDALALDITGVAHLFGDEAGLVAAATDALGRRGLTVQAGLADTPGAAHALARAGGGLARPGATLAALSPLPPATLGLGQDALEVLSRLGLRRVGDLVALPRAHLTRRFGPEVCLRLDQALGAVTEPIAPDRATPHFAARISLPDPIGLVCDVQAGLDRLLARLCTRLTEAGHGACEVILQAGRMDGTSATARLRLARPLGDAGTLARLFAPQIETLEAGFGFDSLRLVALATEPMHPQQISPDMDGPEMAGPQSTLAAHAEGDRLADTMTRLGNRLGFEALYRLAPAQSHIPERAFLKTAAAWSDAADWGYRGCDQTEGGQTGTSMVFGHDTETGTADDTVQTSAHGTGRTIAPLRPLVLFPPEPIAAPPAPMPPHRFRWRGMALRTRAAHGPERIAPEWWFDDPDWRTGLRDYWRVETDQGRRLWLFHTPQSPSWAVQGEFA